jgi:tetratricopeptide (TPR) repeat protein
MKGFPNMKASQVLRRTVRFSLIFTLTVSLTISFLAAEGLAYASAHGSYHYKFVINEDGFTWVTINYESPETSGSSWVFVPKFSNWSYRTLSGRILRSEVVETGDVVGAEHYFYEAFRFSFESNKSFRMRIQFNMTAGALIIEPRGMFFSPQIGFQEDNRGRAEVFLPEDSRVVRANRPPTRETANYVLFDLHENLIRLQIEFRTSIATPELSTLKQDIFTFQTVKRYEGYASDILNLFNAVYDGLVDLFDVTLERVDITFVVPEFYTLLSLGGYVPFTGGKVGDIHINVFSVRFVRGILEVIALHELVHHFLSKAGLPPSDLLWFHEGMAQYISIEVADELGYEGAATERDRLRVGASQLARYGEDFSFLQEWKPETQPVDVTACYVASYSIVSNLAEKYGGLYYYERFFKLIKGKQVEDNSALAYYLSLAANASVALDLRRWGFHIVDLYGLPALVDEAERAVHELSPALQPYSFLAEHLYKQGLAYLEAGDREKASQYLEASISLARFAPLLTLITVAAVLVAVIYVLKGRKVSPKPSDLIVIY